LQHLLGNESYLLAEAKPVVHIGEVSVSKRILVVDAYNVIKVFRDLDVSFEEIAALGRGVLGPAPKAQWEPNPRVLSL